VAKDGEPAARSAWIWEEGDQPTRSAIFARQVRRVREARGWSQGELAKRLAAVGHPLGQTRISVIEAAGPEPRTVSVDQAQAFADAFGVPLEALMFEDYPITRAVILRDLAALLEIADQFAAAAVDSANRSREMVIGYMEKQERPFQLPPGLTDHLGTMEIRQVSAEELKQEAAKQRREAFEEGEQG